MATPPRPYHRDEHHAKLLSMSPKISDYYITPTSVIKIGSIQGTLIEGSTQFDQINDITARTSTLKALLDRVRNLTSEEAYLDFETRTRMCDSIWNRFCATQEEEMAQIEENRLIVSSMNEMIKAHQDQIIRRLQSPGYGISDIQSLGKDLGRQIIAVILMPQHRARCQTHFQDS